MQERQGTGSNWPQSYGLWMLLLMFGFLACFFWRSLLPSQVIFPNGGPIGAASMAALSMPAACSGLWLDLDWLGGNSGTVPADVYYLLFGLLGPIGSAKFNFPLAQLFLALSAWLLFRRTGLGRAASMVGAVAAALNSMIFSDGAGGLMSHTITACKHFLALAAWAGRRRLHWVRQALAGFAAGMRFAEPADIGAFCSQLVSSRGRYQA